jgi:hypothetical protein
VRALKTALVKEEVPGYTAHIWLRTGLRDVGDYRGVVGLSQGAMTLRLLQEVVVLREYVLQGWGHIEEPLMGRRVDMNLPLILQKRFNHFNKLKI